MDYNESDIAEILTFEEESSSGEACKFVDLENGWGIKCFYSSDDCEVSYVTQKEAAQFHLAPNVGKRFELVDHNGDGWYCHMTEVAETLCGYGLRNAHTYKDSEGNDVETFFRNERDDYCLEFEETFDCAYRDDHVGNFGFIERNGRKKLVAIDFNLCIKFYNMIMGIG